MDRQWKISWLVLLLLLCWIPAEKAPEKPAVYRYVQRAELVFCHGTQVERRHWESPEKLTSLLTYLRLTRPRPGMQIDHMPESNHRYRVTLWFSDGSTLVCRLYGYSLLSKNGGLWEAVLPVHAQLIYPLFYYLPSDP